MNVECEICKKVIDRENADTIWRQKGIAHECTYKCKPDCNSVPVEVK